jgi:hypothetical protein
MNETAAREVLLVRAIERADTSQSLLSREDREFASRSATELARWGAAEKRAPLDPREFLARRARLLLDKLDERHQRALRAARAGLWRAPLAALLPPVALLAGALFERLGDTQRINVLALPLLGLVGWNLAVYLVILLGPVLRRLRPGARIEAAGASTLGLLRDALRALLERSTPRASGPLLQPLAAFNDDWRAASAALTAARLSWLLHLCAALFAAGAVAGMYLRGLLFDYRAVWESTLLGATSVHVLLSTLLGPAARLLGDAFPTVAELGALRHPPSNGESAARWIHWYAVTVGVLIIAPRALLALASGWRARRLEQAFPLDLGQPYFRRLLGTLGDTHEVVRAVPFSLTLGPRQREGLASVVSHLWGERSRLQFAPPVAYDPANDDAASHPAAGAPMADAGAADAGASSAPPTLTLALCSLAATPERENHGRFLDDLGQRCGTPHLLLVDAGGYARRLGTLAGASARLDERRVAWRAFAASHGWPVAFADLEAPDLVAAENDLGALAARWA